MAILDTIRATTDAETIRDERDALRGLLAELSEAASRISQNLDPDEALQEVINSA